MGVGFTPDGKTAVSAQATAWFRFWDPATGNVIRSLALLEDADGEARVLRDFAISPDGTRLAGAGRFASAPGAGESGEVWIWSVAKGELLRRIAVDSAGLECLAFSPEGASLATGDRAGRIQLWDVTTGEELLTLRLGNGVIHWLAFAPDGMTLAASDQASGLQLWDLGGGRPLGAARRFSAGRALPLLLPGRPASGVRHDGRRGDRVGSCRTAAAGHGPGLDRQDSLAIAFAPDGQSLAVSGDLEGTLSVIATATGQKRWTIRLGPGPGTGGLAYAPDGKTIISGRGGVLRFVDAAVGMVRVVPDESSRSNP